MTYKKSIAAFLIASFVYNATAQTEGVSIKSTVSPPDPSAMLDIDSPYKGLLVPRVNLLSVTDNTTIKTPATSLLVYCVGNAVMPAGYYYNAGGTGVSPSPNTSWVKFIGAGNELWQLATNNIDIYRNTGNVGIGLTNPSGKLHVAIADNSQRAIRLNNTAANSSFNMWTTTNSAGKNILKMDSDKTGLNVISMSEEGNVGIGTQTPTTLLHVQKGSIPMFRVDAYGHCLFGDEQAVMRPDLILSSKVEGKGSTSHEIFGPWPTVANGDPGSLYISCGNSANGSKNKIYLYSGTTGGDFSCGQVIMYATDGLYVSGNINSGGTITPSDSTLKKNIVTISTSLTKIKQVRPVNFIWKTGNDKTQTGFIAQEVATVFPELVSTYTLPNLPNQPSTNIQKMAVDYTGFIPHLVKAMQEQQVLIEQLQQQNTLLTNRIQALENK